VILFLKPGRDGFREPIRAGCVDVVPDVIDAEEVGAADLTSESRDEGGRAERVMLAGQQAARGNRCLPPEIG
jgi:hypothetical protein